jgi:hypothetical protein
MRFLFHCDRCKAQLYSAACELSRCHCKEIRRSFFLQKTQLKPDIFTDRSRFPSSSLIVSPSLNPMQYLATYCFRGWFLGVLAMGLFVACAESKAQELPSEPFTIIETSPSDLSENSPGKTTKLRRPGKLVSIEGDAETPGAFREWKLSENEPKEAIIESGPSCLDLDQEWMLPKLACTANEPLCDYRWDEDSISYMPGDGNQFGWLSFESMPYIRKGHGSGMVTGLGIHLLSGPEAVALPPRLYDFSIGYQLRARFADVLSYDLASTIGVFSDFEDSARDGVRFPGHAVGMLRLRQSR